MKFQHIHPNLALPTAPSARLAPWVLIVATLLAFGAVATHDFGPIDDLETISGNPKLNPPNFTSEGVLWFWKHPYMGLYVPVTFTVWGLLAKATWVSTADEHNVFVDPHIFHAASLAVHLASVLLVYALIRRLLGRAWPAAAGALLFALHPLQVETVAWTSGLKDLLSAAISLGAVYLYLQATTETRVSLRRRYYFEGMGLLVVAMLCKPAAMVAPVLAAALDYLILRRSARQVAESTLPWFLVVIPLAIVAKIVQPGGESIPAPILQRPILAGASLAFYLGKLVWPVGLTFDYEWEPIRMLHQGWFWGIALIPVPLAAWLFYVRNKQPWLTAAGAIMVAGLLPVLGFVPFMYQYLSTVADHYMYLAMLGPAMALAWGLSLVPRPYWKSAAVACAIGLTLLGGISVRQMRFWQGEDSLIHRMVAISPNSREGHTVIGKLYQSHRDFEGAEREYRLALSVDPDYLPAHENLVNVCSFLGKADEAIAHLHRVIDLRTKRSPAKAEAMKDAFFQVGQLTYSQGFWSDAVKYFTEDLKLNPNHAEGKRLLGLAREQEELKARKSKP